MESRNIHKRIFIIGKVSPGLINSLTTRWIASQAHHYETVRDLREFGEMTLRKAEYNTVLIGEGVPVDERREILASLEQRPDPPLIGIITSEQSYESWVAIPPNPSAQDVADALGFKVRRDPAQIIIISSTKGGVGKSSLSTNLAVMLARMDKPGGGKFNVALIDDDRTTRAIRAMMGIDESSHTSSDMVAEINAAQGVVTREVVEKYLVRSFDVSCLIGPHSIITDFPIELDTSRDVLAIMGLELGFDFIVIDAPPDFINTSTFTYGILSGTMELSTPPLVLIPVVPETLLLRSIDDTLTAITHFQHPIERIWPVINCMRPTHDPESIRGNKVLWREPAGIVPYCHLAQFVGDNKRPLVAEEGQNIFTRFFWSFFLGQASIQDIRKAYGNVGQELVAHLVANGANSNGTS